MAVKMHAVHFLQSIWLSVTLLTAVRLTGSSLDQDRCGNWKNIFVQSVNTYNCDSNYPCRNLSEYLFYPQCFFTSNTTIYFQPGLHLLEQNITVSGVTNLKLVGGSVNSSQQSPSAVIQCSGVPVGLMFENSTNLSLQKIAIVNCGRSLPSNMLPWSSDILDEITVFAALFVANVHKLTTAGIHVVASNGYGLLGWNVMGDSVVLNSKFYCNGKVNASRYCYRQFYSESLGERREISTFGGNALFAFTDTNGSDVHLEGDLHITSSKFSHGGRYQSYFNAFWLPGNLPGDTPVSGGGLAILITPPSNITIKISKCIFDNNIADIGANGFIHIRDSTCYSCHIHVIINNCNFVSGTALEGAGLYINYTDSSFVHIDIHHSNFSDHSSGTSGGGIAFYSTSTIGSWYGSLHFKISTCSFLRNKAGRGAGFYGVLSKRVQNPDYYGIIQVRIVDTKFSQNVANDGGGLFLLTKSNVMYGTDAMQSFLLTNCSFRKCRAYTGAAVRIDNCYQSPFQSRVDCFMPSGLEAMIVFRNVVFRNSGVRLGTLCSGALYLRNMHDVSLKDIQFINNNCSSVYAVNSQIACKGKLQFHSNKAFNGGAFDLNCVSDTSLVYLYPKSKLYISNNSAEYGGAIAARQDCGDSQLCFFQPTLSENWPKGKLPQVILKNNTASIKGNSIYVKGGEPCEVLQENVYGDLHPSIFWSIFTIHGMNQIAATSYKVCFCLDSCAGSLPEWMKEDECPTVYNITVYRGKSFNTTVVGVGQYNYPITSVLQTSLESESGSARLGIRQHAQELSYSCTNVTYSIASIEDEVKLFLSVENSVLSLGSALLSSTPTILKVTLLPCPFGFELLGMPSTCGCAAPLRHIPGISCDIDTTLIHHPPSMWIGRYSIANIIVVHRNCPFDYCKPGRTYVNVSNPDEQCASGHAGILCGGCKPGLSLALGTSQCLQCSNIYLLLIIPFLLAGIVLVFLLLKCNLTVSVGTINGLIFYVNIVRVSHTIFFPHKTTNIFTNILSVFISWLNLDLGIETCFFSGMDSYAKTWLQFLFPLYIWVMVAVMILTSRYSTNVARLIGSNAVQVLATLFLLSYAKLLRTVIAIASFTTLSVENGDIRNIWLLDGNVAFMSGPHVALFIAGMLATIFYILPFTALVALSPFLQARSGYKFLRWIKKLKPFLDAYHGPYKDKFRYWTGLMLVVRLVLFAIFAGNALGDPQINLFATIMIVFLIMIYCWNRGNVYKNHVLNILDSFYILNLGIFATASMFLKASQRSSQLNQEILACVMVGSVFVLSCTILFYHLLEQIKKKGIPRWILRHFRKTSEVEVEVQSNCSGKASPEPPPLQPPTVTTVDLSQLRESLLSDNL